MNNVMRYFLLFVNLLLVSHLLVAANTESNTYSLKKANELYVNTQYAEAIIEYEEILRTGYESAVLYYNLGNAYYRENKIASAILNYERALRLQPSNGDVQHNLNLAKAKTLDKIIPLEKNVLQKWYESILYLTHTNIWAYWSMALFIASLLVALLYLFTRIKWIRKTAFISSLLVFAFSLLFLHFSYKQKKTIENVNEGIIFAPTITIKSSPDELGSDLFILHEGTKVVIKNQLGNWVQIETEDDNKGWLPVSAIEKI
jgi:tetratricopeptide (TPR) repeat protein